MANGENPKGTRMPSGLGIKYKNHIHNLTHTHIDSVYIIIDKFDRSGSGIVRKVFHPGHNNEFGIPELMAGKYIVYIKFLGFHNEQFKRTVIVKRQNPPLTRRTWFSTIGY
jgi:hypothetical protein